jgi:hypothetical protein
MLKRLVLFCAALLPLAVGAEVEKYATVCDTSICFYWWPKVSPIPGWHHDQEQSIHLSANVWVPDGDSFADAQAVMYAKAIYRPREPELDSLQALIKSDQRFFLEHEPDVVITEGPVLRTADGKAWQSFAFVPGKQGHWERVAYGEEGDYYLVFTFSARDKASYERLAPLFVSWIERYQEAP